MRWARCYGECAHSSVSACAYVPVSVSFACDQNVFLSDGTAVQQNLLRPETGSGVDNMTTLRSQAAPGSRKRTAPYYLFIIPFVVSDSYVDVVLLRSR